MINWTISKEDSEIAVKIAKRAVATAKKHDIQLDQMSTLMDIEACHNNGCPLKLQELLDADDFNFAHDVFGIRQHIDRATGELPDCFLPRYAC